MPKHAFTTRMGGVLAAAILSLTAGTANAYIAEDWTWQTADGQDFVFEFAIPPAPMPGSAGTLHVMAETDFCCSSGEWLNISFEGTDLGTYDIELTSGAWTALGGNNAEFDMTFTISLADMEAAAADGTFTTTVDLGPSVNVITPEPYVLVSLEYDAYVPPPEPEPVDDPVDTVDHQPNTSIPEPGTLAVLGFGLAGLGFIRRRRAAA